MTLGIPVIASNTSVHRYYLSDEVVQFFQCGDSDDLAACIYKLYKNRHLRNKLRQNAFKFIENYKWDAHKQQYLNLVKNL